MLSIPPYRARFLKDMSDLPSLPCIEKLSFLNCNQIWTLVQGQKKRGSEGGPMVSFQLSLIRDFVESGPGGFLPVNDILADVESGVP
jgi:hypothetical protein